MLDIVRMGLERRDRIAAIWVAAFEHDPLMGWIFPGEPARLESLRRWWGFTLDHLLPGSELHGTRTDGCVAYWQPPRGDEALPMAQDAGAEFVTMMNELLGELAPSRMEALGRMHQARPSDPHWYLAVLGTSPEQQSKGLGGRVLAPMLERCDRIGLPAYLESSNPANVGFYRRHGFEPSGRFTLGGQVLITPMIREPIPPRA
ncbi:GNAT family N-acetyltransferase [Candidatus Poriferisocius sp.]|uniref:GNAT family N-acetyltransferase n=1 Tax=Candidatus Poriferisocius sp. TaxID=3101276 RepID=UPI003B02B3B9